MFQKAQKVIPIKKRFKEGTENDDIMDLELNEINCLKRYHSAFRAIVTSGVLSPLDNPLREEHIGKNIQNTIVDWSVAHALLGSTLIDELQTNMSYTVLPAALILTITIPLYVNIPEFQDENYSRAFSALVGFSAFSHILVLIGCTIQNMILNRPYSHADTLGLVGKKIDGYVQLYCIGFFTYLLFLFIHSYQKGTVYQDRRIHRFYQRYCDEDGQLKDEYIEKIRKHLNKKEENDDEV